MNMVPADDRYEVYGFQWGNVIVERTTEFNGTKVLTIKAGSNKLSVYISKTGKSMRVFDKDSQEMKVPKPDWPTTGD